jgi:hypothetical protein
MARSNSHGTIARQRFGRLVVLAETNYRDRTQSIRWLCQCDCGNLCLATRTALRRGSKKSCGCLRKELDKILPTRPVTHGMSRTSTFKSWCTMIRRCRDQNYKDYKYYGGRGIIVCERWHSFENFYADMGERPPGMTLDRVNTDLQYNKQNCRWADHTTQMNNTRRNRYLTYRGVTLTMSQWAKQANISYTVLRARLNLLRWPLGRALGYEYMSLENAQVLTRGSISSPKTTRIQLIKPPSIKRLSKLSINLSVLRACLRIVIDR